jgi:lysophospholipid acyltransferase (LPLAT)-like uncharacterized protein
VNVRTAAVPVLGAALIRALGATWRIRPVDDEHRVAARERSPRLIFAFWHGRLLPLTYEYRDRGARILASQHADGELLGQTLRFLGYGHVRGSSTRGGSRAIMELVEELRSGHDLGLTVDGPRGPRHVVKPGVVEIAKLTGSAILPITSASRRHRTFASWDRFELPYPWARVVVRYGPAVTVPADADRDLMEARRLDVERILNHITAEADRDVAQ